MHNCNIKYRIKKFLIRRNRIACIYNTFRTSIFKNISYPERNLSTIQPKSITGSRPLLISPNSFYIFTRNKNELTCLQEQSFCNFDQSKFFDGHSPLPMPGNNSDIFTEAQQFHELHILILNAPFNLGLPRIELNVVCIFFNTHFLYLLPKFYFFCSVLFLAI